MGRARNLALALLAGLGWSGAAAAAPTAPAAAATTAPALSISVLPAGPIHHKQRFTITLTATLAKSHASGKKAFLLAFIQYSSKPCERDVNKELQRTLPTRGAYYQHSFSASPFTSTKAFIAGAPGNRRVCGYLFSKPVKPDTTAAPIAHNHATYQVVK